jgi:hypothetical protein
MKLPTMIPRAKTTVQMPDRHLWCFRYSNLPGAHIAPISWKLVEMPNALPASKNNSGTVSPIKIPENHHGHGCMMKSIIDSGLG